MQAGGTPFVFATNGWLTRGVVAGQIKCLFGELEGAVEYDGKDKKVQSRGRPSVSILLSTLGVLPSTLGVLSTLQSTLGVLLSTLGVLLSTLGVPLRTAGLRPARSLRSAVGVVGVGDSDQWRSACRPAYIYAYIMYMYIYIYICIHIHIHIQMNNHMFIYIQTYKPGVARPPQDAWRGTAR